MKNLVLSCSKTLQIIFILGLALLPTTTAYATYTGIDSGIVYIQNLGNRQAPYRESSTGSGKTLVPLPNGLSVSRPPEFSRDGQYMYFTYNDGNGVAVYSSKADGTLRQRVSQYGIDGILSLSRDGSLLAVTGNDVLSVLDIATGENYDITAGDFTNPLWSPDDRYIVISENNGGVYKIDLETGNVIQLFSEIPNTTVLDWSPDGSTLLLRANAQVNSMDGSIVTEIGHFNLLFSDSNGDNLHNYNVNNISGDRDYYFGKFSPDGSRIVFNATENSYYTVNGTQHPMHGIYVSNNLTLSGGETLLEQDVTWQTSVSWLSFDSSIQSTLPAPHIQTLPIERFYSPVVRHHLYTADQNEVNHIRSNMWSVWSDEGVAYRVKAVSGCVSGENVYRFYSEQLRTHLFTMDENEKAVLIGYNRPDVWRYEGVAYCADKSQVSVQQVPVYRFYSEQLKTHLYTVDENERNTLIGWNRPDIWRYEGVAYYAYPSSY